LQRTCRNQFSVRFLHCERNGNAHSFGGFAIDAADFSRDASEIFGERQAVNQENARE
jgi:hypothetical protein